MKIHSIRQHFGHRQGATVRRLLAVCGAVALAVTTCQSVSAQSGLMGVFSGEGTSQAAGPSGPHITHDNEAFRVVSASGIRTAADIGTPAHARTAAPSRAVQQVGFGESCSSCGGGCGGACGSSVSCGSCGTQCGGACRGSINACRSSPGGGYSPFSGYGNPCLPCAPYMYGSLEALYMERDGKERFSLSPDYIPGGFDYETAGRVTLGIVPDCVHGYEVSYTGRFLWDTAARVSDPAGNLRSFLVPVAPFVPADLSAFNDTVVDSAQAYGAKLWSVEANKTFIGWDVAKVLYGVRYTDYDESYAFISQNNAGEVGLLASTTESRMFGVQAGLDLLYPISRFGYADFRSRIGGLINFAESDFALINDGTFLALSSDDDTKIAGVIEFGGGVRYYLGQLLSVRLGAELFYYKNVAEVSDQFTNQISLQTGRNTSVRGDFFAAGASVGAELRW